MKIPIYCDHCDKLIATVDTKADVSCDWAEASCGEKVCEECCEYCQAEHFIDGSCPHRYEAHLD